MRKNVQPGSNEKDTKNSAPFVFETFSRGTIQDAPASEIQDCLADSLNLTIYPGFYEGRLGCRLYTQARFPSIEDRTGYTAHKEGTHILSDSGDIFTFQDVGNYFCFGDRYELITGYVNAHEVIGENSTYRDGVDCSVMGAPNVFFFHKSLRQWIIMLGRDIYTAEIAIPSWEKILVISRDLPFSSKTDYSEYKNKTVFFNGGGMFKIDAGASYPIAYRVNIDPPNIRILSVAQTLSSNCRYRYLYSAARLQRDGGIVDRQTPSEIDAETGTNVADAQNIDYAEVYTDDEISTVHPNTVRELWVPVIANTDPQEYQWHLSHFPIWRSFDLEAKDPSDVEKTKYNDPNRYIWAKDLRICAAFYVRIVGNRCYSLRGTFELADTYSILELDDGQRFEILEYISELEVRIADEYYNYSPIGPAAAAIGNGDVIRASVTGDILTRTHGATFSAADVRKTIWNSEGYRFYITEYLDANRVRLHISSDQPVQGFTMDPTHRNFYDTITDEILRARKDFYSCYARYRSALPSGNIGAIIPGFIVIAYRGQKEIYYSHLENKMSHLIGQHIGVQVSEEVQDAVQFFHAFQNVLAAICATSTWGVPVGLSEFMTLPQSTEAVALLPGIKIINKNIGSLDQGSVNEIEGDVIELVTNEPGGEALRQFNGTSYSEENFLVDPSLGGRIVRAFQKTKKLSMAIYDGIMGYILWRKNA